MAAPERWERLALAATGLLLLALVGSALVGLFQPRSAQPALGGNEPSRLTAVDVPPTSRGRIEVLNGAGRAGLARHATSLLRSGAFDVVYFGNARSRTDSSEVIDRVGQPQIARAVAERLGIGRVRSEPDPSLLLDATVILGRDWTGPPR